MQSFFLFNTFLSLALIVVLAVLNLLVPSKISVHYRLAAAGFGTAIPIVLYALGCLSVLPADDRYIALVAFFVSLAAVLDLSFLVDLTATARGKRFFLLYLLPFVLGPVSAAVPRPFALAFLAGAALLALAGYSLSIMLAWIRNANDDRARRDGEWVLMVFAAFALGLVVCFFHALTGVFWLLAIWYLVMYLAVNHLKILRQLGSRENVLVLDNISDIVLLLDPNGMIVRVNWRGVQLSGFSPATVNGMGFEKLIVHPELMAGNRREWLERFSWLDSGRSRAGARSTQTSRSVRARRFRLTSGSYACRTSAGRRAATSSRPATSG